MATADEYAAWIVANADKKGTPAFDTVAAAYQEAKTQQPTSGGDSFAGEVKQHAGNLVAGAVRGAGSIGATILAPYDMAKDAIAGKGLSLESNRQRRAGIDEGLQAMGAEPDSMLYKTGKISGEIAGTAGAGGVVGNAIGRVAPALAAATRSGGFALDGMGGSSTLANGATRVAGGAINGGAVAGMVNPEDAGMGSVVGASIPVAGKVAGEAGNAVGNFVSGKSKALAESLMQSAIKPTIAQLRKGQVEPAIQTLLENGINVTKGGVDKLRGKIGDLNDQIGTSISNSTATVNRQSVLDALNDTRGKFVNQVSPASDLGAIDSVAEGFANHPSIPSNEIPVQLAQKLKQGTYKVLSGKYGEAGSASTEAQKALARGLKDKIAEAVPEIASLNAQESKLINALNVTERRALMDANKNPMGLAALASHPASWAAFMADKSALFKSLAARAAYGASNSLNGQGRNQALSNLLKSQPMLAAPEVAIAQTQ